jgi:hypothetical protein
MALSELLDLGLSREIQVMAKELVCWKTAPSSSTSPTPSIVVTERGAMELSGDRHGIITGFLNLGREAGSHMKISQQSQVSSCVFGKDFS